MSDSQYNDFALNAAGLSNISKTGVTKMGSCLTNDADNSAPSWGSAHDNYVDINFADAGSNKPKLVITYTIPDNPGIINFI